MGLENLEQLLDIASKQAEKSDAERMPDEISCGENDAERMPDEISCGENDAERMPNEIWYGDDAEKLPKEIDVGKADVSHDGLSDIEKGIIKKETGWSEEIINNIGSMKEYEIYIKANLTEVQVGNRICLIRSDIDFKQKDIMGRTNEQRMGDGLAPLDKNGKRIELHHIGQHAYSPLAELTFEEHHCGGNDTILHNKTKNSEVHGEGNSWDKERTGHWTDRANERSKNE